MTNKNIVPLLILAAVAVSIYAASGGNLFSVGGISILSLSNIDYQSNDAELNGASWTVAGVLTGNGNYLIAQSNPTQLKDQQTGEISTSQLTIKADTLPQTCSYGIDNRGKAEKIYTIANEKIEFGLFKQYFSSTDATNACKNKLDYYYFAQKAWDGYVNCFRKTESGTHGVLTTPSTIWSATITASTSDGKSESKIITNWGSQSVWIGNDVKVQWTGSLVGAEQCPLSNLPDTVFSNGYWTTVDRQKWLNYNNYHTTGFDLCANKYVLGTITNIDSCVNDYNSYSSSAMIGKPLSMTVNYADQTSETFSVSTGSANIDTGKIELQVNKFLQFPMLIFKIKAAWVGVVVPVGQPDIISATDLSFTTGSQASTTVQIKNIGTGQGSFDYSALCSAGFSQYSKTPDYLQLNPQQTGNAYIYVSGTCSQDTSGTCTITAYDRNNPTKKDEQTIKTGCKTICEASEPAGTRVCKNNALAESDGCRYKQIDTCDLGCEYKSGIAQCKTPPKGCQSDLECDDKNQYTTDKCIRPLIGDSYCENKANCALENQAGGGLLQQPCCPTASDGKTPLVRDDKSGLCLKGGGLGDINLLYIIFPALGGLLLYLTKKKAPLWAVVGVIAGIIIAFALDFVFKNWLILLIGGALGGGIILYLFGGTILMIIMALIARKK